MNTKLIQSELKHFSAAERQRILAADALAAKAHRGQLRKSGQPYIIHPRHVATTLAAWGMDADTVVAGLLHDTVEDTHVTLADIKAEFGEEVAGLVEAVTKLGAIQAPPGVDSLRHEISNENIRKLLLAMTRDLRVIVIKLADRLHNLQTLQYLLPEQQQRIARESLEIYAPLADRLGMGELKCQLEDLSFRFVETDAHARVAKLMSGYVSQSQSYINAFKHTIAAQLKRAGIEVASIEGRQKHLYSVYKKLRKAEDDLSKIYDLIAIRVIVPTEANCYEALGILHQTYKPLIYRIKDYIAVPKPNGYRSLHTTVFGPDGRITEIQIRTPQMHQEAERGLAAHFYYDTQKSQKSYQAREAASTLPQKFTWVSGLADLSAATGSGAEFVEALKIDLFQDRIFVFSPKGDLYDLPENSTPVDFAFAVHTDIGLRTQGAKVNGRIATLDHRLENRDVVEILTRKQPKPNRDWLSFVQTPHARNRIRAWFRSIGREQNIETGRALLEQELKAWGYKHIDELPPDKQALIDGGMNHGDRDGLLASLGEGELTARTILHKLFSPATATKTPVSALKPTAGTGKVTVADAPDMPYVIAPCCKPTFPQAIVGYITRGSGLTIHRQGCGNVPADDDRLIDCYWEVAGTGAAQMCRLQILSQNRVGMLHDITGTIATRGLNISGIKSSERTEGTEVVIELGVEVPDMYALAGVIKKLEQLPGIKNVERTS